MVDFFFQAVQNFTHCNERKLPLECIFGQYFCQYETVSSISPTKKVMPKGLSCVSYFLILQSCNLSRSLFSKISIEQDNFLMFFTPYMKQSVNTKEK